MNSYNDLWRKWSGMIFWSVLVLSVIGLFTGIFEYVDALASTVSGILGAVGKFVAGDLTDRADFISDSVSNVLMTSQLMLLAAWVCYLVGIRRFRTAQISEQAVESVSSLNGACWTGIIGIVLSFFAGFLPAGINLLLSVPGWILLLVSYYRFKESFNELKGEPTWGDKARVGASQLRKSAVFNIRLMWYPLICIAVFGVLAVAFIFQAHEGKSSIGSLTEGYGAIALLLAVVLGLYALYMAVMQFVYRLLGWYKIWKDLPVAENAVMESVEEPLPSASAETESQGEPKKYNKVALIVGTVVPAALICWGIVALVRSGHADQVDSDGSEYVVVANADGRGYDIVAADGAVVASGLFTPDCSVSSVVDGVFWVACDGLFRLHSVANPATPVNNETYKAATVFGGGVAAVGDGMSPIKLIDTRGKIVATLADTIARVGRFGAEGLAPFRGSCGKWGYIDREGTTVIKPTYDYALPFEDGLAIVGSDEGCDSPEFRISVDGYKIGAEKINGLILNHKDNGFDYVVDEEGKTIIPSIYERIKIINADRFIVRNADECGMIDSKLNPIIPFEGTVDIVPLAGGRLLHVVRENGAICSFIVDFYGQRIAGPFGSPIENYLDERQVTYTDLGSVFDPVLAQLGESEVIGFGKETDATAVAQRFGWTVNRSNAVNFLYPSADSKSYYIELSDGNYADAFMSFTDSLVVERDDNYVFNPDARLIGVKMSLRLPDGADLDSARDFIARKLVDSGFTSENRRDFYRKGVASDGLPCSYSVSISSPDGDLILDCSLPENDFSKYD